MHELTIIGVGEWSGEDTKWWQHVGVIYPTWLEKELMILNIATKWFLNVQLSSIATALGHQDQEAKHLHLTKLPKATINGLDIDISPVTKPCIDILCSMVYPKLRSYSDQTWNPQDKFVHIWIISSWNQLCTCFANTELSRSYKYNIHGNKNIKLCCPKVIKLSTTSWTMRSARI